MSKYEIKYSAAFKKSIKAFRHDKPTLAEIERIIDKLANDETLEQKHKDHALSGSLAGFRECHIRPDLLLIYEKQDDLLILTAINIGSHSKLFKS